MVAKPSQRQLRAIQRPHSAFDIFEVDLSAVRIGAWITWRANRFIKLLVDDTQDRSITFEPRVTQQSLCYRTLQVQPALSPMSRFRAPVRLGTSSSNPNL